MASFGLMPRPPVELLACPSCRGRLVEETECLRCAGCGRTYPFCGDAPRLLPDDSRGAEEGAPGLLGRALATFARIPFVYDLIQRLAGADKIARRLRPILAATRSGLVVDIGAGTGSLEKLLPASARYLWLDLDPTKLRGFRAKSNAPAVLGDATRIPMHDQSADWAVSVAVSHHLDDGQLGAMLDELRRITKGHLFFLDAVVEPRLWSRLLWRYDRGRNPRTAAALTEQISRRFTIVTREEFTMLHTYLLVTAT